MNKEDLFTISYPTDNEKKLKSVLNNSNLEYGLTKTYDYLAFRNQLLLKSCNIDENEFSYILFRNYIYFLNNASNFNLDKLSERDKDTIEEFNKLINSNDFIGAMEMYSDNFLIHELLCNAYIKNLQKTELDKINGVCDSKVEDIFNKISILKNTDLTFNRETPKKIKVNVSNR